MCRSTAPRSPSLRCSAGRSVTARLRALTPLENAAPDPRGQPVSLVVVPTPSSAAASATNCSANSRSIKNSGTRQPRIIDTTTIVTRVVRETGKPLAREHALRMPRTRRDQAVQYGTSAIDPPLQNSAAVVRGHRRLDGPIVVPVLARRPAGPRAPVDLCALDPMLMSRSPSKRRAAQEAVSPEPASRSPSKLRPDRAVLARGGGGGETEDPPPTPPEYGGIRRCSVVRSPSRSLFAGRTGEVTRCRAG